MLDPEEGYVVTGEADENTFNEVVERIKAEGFKKDAEEYNMMGMMMYMALNSKGQEANALLMNGTFTVAITEN